MTYTLGSSAPSYIIHNQHKLLNNIYVGHQGTVRLKSNVSRQEEKTKKGSGILTRILHKTNNKTTVLESTVTAAITKGLQCALPYFTDKNNLLTTHPFNVSLKKNKALR